MNRRERIDRFQLDDDSTIHHHVELKCRFELDGLIDERDGFLDLNGVTALGQLEGQARRVRGFE